MLEQILDYINNYFEKEKKSGTFEIQSGLLNADFLQDGQYYRITGSVFNDGIHKYPDNDLDDEIFTGDVWAMAVPRSVVALSVEIEDWVSQHADVLNSPYQSESFGGYSYSKGSGKNGSALGWKDVFGSRLNRWRKI